jgi:homospermidine synthase
VIWEFELSVLDPSVHDLTGEDLVGVLLVFEDSEAYMYNVLSNKEIYETFQTNATYFQVASGVYAGIASLLLDDLPKGVFYVDELLLKTDSKYGSYLQTYMKEFIIGENPQSDGLLLKRMRKPE